jgi:putative glycosyltransferase (TIGR04372 family)
MIKNILSKKKFFFSLHHYFLYKIGILFKVIIIIPNPDSIGNAAEEIYFGALKARKEKKKLAIIFTKKIPFLNYLNFHDTNFFSLESEYFLFKHNSFIQNFCGYLFSLFFLFSKFVHGILTKFFSFEKSGFYWRPMAGSDILWRPSYKTLDFKMNKFKNLNWNKQFCEHLDVNILKKSNVKCESILKKLGFKEKKFVCIHVREGGYKNDFTSNLLNLDIMNFVSSIKEICKRDILVFRLGDSSMTKLPKIKNLIDYPFSDFRSPEMDNYLIKNCIFFICGPSGPLDTARRIHRTRVLLHNSGNFWNLPFNRGDIGLIRPLYSKSRNKYLSIKEMLEMLLNYKRTTHPWNIQDDIIMKENNENEILAAVKEMLNYNFLPETELQREYKRLCTKINNKFVKNFSFQINKLENVNDQYRFATGRYWEGKISEEFLRKNWKKSSRNISK